MIINNRFIPGNITKAGNSTVNNQTERTAAPQNSFGAILREKIDEGSGLKFSKHAQTRLQERNINLTSIQKEKLNTAVNKAGNKGVKETLVLVDNLAFVVNVRSKTVITAVNSQELKENVFTNIDGAVFI